MTETESIFAIYLQRWDENTGEYVGEPISDEKLESGFRFAGLTIYYGGSAYTASSVNFERGEDSLS